ncbi:hypothetical protein [Mesorhizobium sangaii]|uniref:Uncharacterized protein n=1 Tax=Mesorhizobium sangaii TaxID=505389 RepID=A0A841PRK6_9HYPH|nr:hypothetical protein [Mesorhizobium sangaii]MBB6412779.1 hypothetical protein [Mesorhizobium sangaii]
MTSNNIRYVSLMVVETAAAMFLFLTIFPIFRQVITQLGEPQDISHYEQSAVVCGALVLQTCYWVRFRWVAIPAPFRNALVRHLFLFASRVSFFFGGALFSVFFFRHVPELDRFPSFIQGAVKLLDVLLVLFSLFCYSLEIERLGRAREDHSSAPGRTR